MSGRLLAPPWPQDAPPTVELDVTLRRQTPLAWGIAHPKTYQVVWIGKSVSQLTGGLPPSYKGKLLLPRWLAKREGLIE